MPRNLSLSSAPLADDSAAGEELRIYLRDSDDNGNALTGTDRVYINYKVRVTGDDGSVRYQNVSRQLAAVPNGVWSAQDKLDLWNLVKAGHAAARAVATND